MKTTDLIKGQFTPEEAREILCDMLKSKINFHNIKSLSSLVRFNQPSPESELRIQELQEAREQLLALIQQAEDLNMDLHIESTINVSFQLKEQSAEVCSKAGDY